MAPTVDAGRLDKPAHILLSIVAGYVDGCTYLALFGLFVAQVTGSFVVAGAQLVDDSDGALLKILAIPVFLAAAAAATLLVAHARHHGYRALPIALIAEATLLAAVMSIGVATWPFLDQGATPALLAGLAGLSAMGLQSALVRLMLRGGASTNVMTTNTTQLAIDATEFALAWWARWRSADESAHRDYAAARAQFMGLLPVVLGFAAGTAAGAVSFIFLGFWCLLPAIAIVFGMAVRALR